MALYVIPVPQPPAGVDWTYTVPGQYIEHITAVSATLTTSSSAAPTTAVDASGNGNNGTYSGAGASSPFVAGLVPGDVAVRMDLSPLSTSVKNVLTPVALYDWSTPFSFACLWENPTGGSVTFYAYDATNAFGVGGNLQFLWGDGSDVMTLTDSAGESWTTATGVIPQDGLPHLLAVTRSGATVKFYVDGVQTATTVASGNFSGPTMLNAGINGAFAATAAGTGICDEWAGWRRAITAAEITSLQSARGSFAAYSAAVLATSPTSYYHLNDAPATGSRQVDLRITDGTHTVVEAPTGFAEVSTAGPYAYSWQPNLNSSTQTPDAKLTTVAIPDLVIPAGYTLGTRTLDLGASDQWSAIFIWWDDSLMQGLQGHGVFDYGDGAYLYYQREPV